MVINRIAESLERIAFALEALANVQAPTKNQKHSVSVISEGDQYTKQEREILKRITEKEKEADEEFVSKNKYLFESDDPTKQDESYY